MAETAYPSPNFGPRRDGLRPELVVLHYTAMAECAAAKRVLCDPAREVSAHYLIGRDGTVHPLVPEEMRAWHAGAGTWAGRGDVNSRSIGIELDNDGATPFSEPLMAALEALLPKVLSRWQIVPQGVIGHSDMAPERKIDPGPRFDWRRLARGGMAVWPELRSGSNGAADWTQFRTDAQAFGYGDWPNEVLLSAFRLRFRPHFCGPLAPQDCAMASHLAQRFGLDRGRAGA